jgi:hypothetical protein
MPNLFISHLFNLTARPRLFPAIFALLSIALLLPCCAVSKLIAPLPSACAESFASALANAARPAPAPADSTELWVFLSFCNRRVPALKIRCWRR